MADQESRKVIVIFGATGQQGGSVLEAMKSDKRFALKAVTRDLGSPKAKQLAAEGIEPIKVDMDDPVSCKAGLKGAYGVFLVTNVLGWDEKACHLEIQQGKNVVDAVKENQIKHLVFSGLPSPKELIGKDGCYHFESKKAIYDYIVASGVPYTVVQFAMYFENILGTMPPRKNENGEYVLDIPMGSAPLGMVAATETGEAIHQIFANPDEYKGQWIRLASHNATVAEYAAVLTKVIGKKFVAGSVTVEQFAQMGFPGATDLAVMFEFFASSQCKYNIELTRKLHPSIPDYEQWVVKNRAAIEKAVCK